jgi:hypothetical protein
MYAPFWAEGDVATVTDAADLMIFGDGAVHALVVVVPLKDYGSRPDRHQAYRSVFNKSLGHISGTAARNIAVQTYLSPLGARARCLIRSARELERAGWRCRA